MTSLITQPSAKTIEQIMARANVTVRFDGGKLSAPKPVIPELTPQQKREATNALRRSRHVPKPKQPTLLDKKRVIRHSQILELLAMHAPHGLSSAMIQHLLYGRKMTTVYRDLQLMRAALTITCADGVYYAL